MTDDQKLMQLEDRLRQEADLLLKHHGKRIPAAALQTEYHRRKRSRRQRLAAGLATGLVLLIGAGAYVTGLLRPEELANDRYGTPTGLSDGPKNTTITQKPATQNNEQPGLQQAEQQEQIAHRLDDNLLPAYPLLITVSHGQRRHVIATGIYLPPRVEQVELRDLSPTEQSGVKRVLGMDQKNVFGGPI